MFKSIIAIAALVTCSGAWSAPFDSNWLYEKCELESPSANDLGPHGPDMIGQV